MYTPKTQTTNSIIAQFPKLKVYNSLTQKKVSNFELVNSFRMNSYLQIPIRLLGTNVDPLFMMSHTWDTLAPMSASTLSAAS